MTKVSEKSKLTTYGNIINGKSVQAKDGEVSNSIDPSTGEVWAKIPSSKKEDAELVIQAARGAFEDWSNLPARTRGDYMRKIGDMISDNATELLELETRNNGWVLDEYGYLAEVLKQVWYDAAGAAH